LNSPITTLSSLSKDHDFLSTESSREDTQQTIQKIHQLVKQALDSLREVEKGEISYCLSMKEVLEPAAQKLDETSPNTSLKTLSHESLSGPVDNLQANLTLAILSNLFQNSAEAQPHAEIVLEGKRKGKNWELLISDNCGGIAPNLLPRIFSPVVSPKPGGSGIGLALSKQLAESMEGALQLESSDASGTRFRLTVPALEGVTTN
jgi:two-component system sensor histidine kinase HydH